MSFTHKTGHCRLCKRKATKRVEYMTYDYIKGAAGGTRKNVQSRSMMVCSKHANAITHRVLRLMDPDATTPQDD